MFGLKVFRLALFNIATTQLAPHSVYKERLRIRKGSYTKV